MCFFIELNFLGYNLVFSLTRVSPCNLVLEAPKEILLEVDRSVRGGRRRIIANVATENTGRVRIEDVLSDDGPGSTQHFQARAHIGYKCIFLYFILILKPA